MDFFEHQERARKKTGLLVFYFFVAVVLIVMAVHSLISFVTLYLKYDNRVWQNITFIKFFEPRLLINVSGVTLFVIFLATIWKIVSLREGGVLIARSLGGRKVNPATPDLKEKRLINVVEEMALASGVPVPEVFVLDEEKGINAFAAGFTTKDAVVAVTKGTLEHLNRDELQGVIAHEFSHILNGDMKLNLHLIGVLNGILFIGLFGKGILRTLFYSRRRSYSSSSKRNNDARIILIILIFALLLWLIGMVGLFFGRLIKSAISREREYLADASAVQFTRNPNGIASALKKIGGLSTGSYIQSAKADEMSHLFFNTALSKGFFNLMATHPPLIERIKRIDPQFSGTFMKTVSGMSSEGAGAKSFAGEFTSPFKKSKAKAVTKLETGKTGVFVVNSSEFMKHVGTLTPENFQYAKDCIGQLPDFVHKAVHDVYSAQPVLFCILFSTDPIIQKRQEDYLKENLSSEMFKLILEYKAESQRLKEGQKLMVIDLAIPALKDLSVNQYQAFKRHVQFLIEADKKIDIFEYTVTKALIRKLEPHFGLGKKRLVQYHTIKPFQKELEMILSVLAYAGAEKDLEKAKKAFRNGVLTLHLRNLNFNLLPEDSCDIGQCDSALEVFSQTTPFLKKRILESCTNVVLEDKMVTTKEVALLRAFADALECPVPPVACEAAYRT